MILFNFIVFAAFISICQSHKNDTESVVHLKNDMARISKELRKLMEHIAVHISDGAKLEPLTNLSRSSTLINHSMSAQRELNSIAPKSNLPVTTPNPIFIKKYTRGSKQAKYDETIPKTNSSLDRRTDDSIISQTEVTTSSEVTDRTESLTETSTESFSSNTTFEDLKSSKKPTTFKNIFFTKSNIPTKTTVFTETKTHSSGTIKLKSAPVKSSASRHVAKIEKTVPMTAHAQTKLTLSNLNIKSTDTTLLWTKDKKKIIKTNYSYTPVSATDSPVSHFVDANDKRTSTDQSIISTYQPNLISEATTSGRTEIGTTTEVTTSSAVTDRTESLTESSTESYLSTTNFENSKSSQKPTTFKKILFTKSNIPSKTTSFPETMSNSSGTITSTSAPTKTSTSSHVATIDKTVPMTTHAQTKLTLSNLNIKSTDKTLLRTNDKKKNIRTDDSKTPVGSTDSPVSHFFESNVKLTSTDQSIISSYQPESTETATSTESDFSVSSSEQPLTLTDSLLTTLAQTTQSVKDNTEVSKESCGPCLLHVKTRPGFFCDCRNLAPEKDCLSFYKKRIKIDGVYNLTINGRIVSVFCDQTTDGGGWTVIQRRLDGAVNFRRNWQQYKVGFGDSLADFWLGNDNIFKLSQYKSELRIEMEDWDGIKKYAKYKKFKISDESEKYKLNVEGYSGDAGDALVRKNNGMLFTTFDQNNNDWSKSVDCFELNIGGWWYDNCDFSGLNGKYHSSKTSRHGAGINWYPWRGHFYSLKRVEMKMRRA